MIRRMISALAAALFVALAVCGPGAGPVAAQEAYRLGEGDVVKLNVFQRPDLSAEERLGAGGRIFVPGGGKLNIGGQTVSDAEDQIRALLAKTGATPNPQVDLQIVTFGSQKVSVFGYVKAPGSYALDRPSRVSEVLAQAGGILADGSPRVTLIREAGGGQISRVVINMKEVLDGSNAGADQEVRGGDMINVPRAPRVYVYGAVNHPGPYILEDGMTALQMISLAGGITSTGSDGRLEVVRHGEAGKAQSLKVGLQDKLLPEDVLIVHESIF